MSQNNKKTESVWESGLKWAAAAAVVGTTAYVMYKAGEDSANRSHELQKQSTGTHCNQPEMCVVCLDKMTPLRRLNCGHVFHNDCASQWLNEKPICPLCRRQQ